MESHKRTIAKTLSWRLLSIVITSLVVWRITGQSKLGIAVALLDCAVKMFAYYAHERGWNSIAFGYMPVVLTPIKIERVKERSLSTEIKY